MDHNVTTTAPQEIQTIATPAHLIIDLMRRSNDAREFIEPSELYNALPQTGFKPGYLLDELTQLGIITVSGNELCLERYTDRRILDVLALAGALSALSAYQCALLPSPPDYSFLTQIHDAIRTLDHSDPKNLLQGAYLDYQFHLEIVRLSENRPAFEAYIAAIKPAIWLIAANYYSLTDAPSSIAEHERIITIMQRRDSLRARDAAAWHVESAIDHISKAAKAQRQSYPESAN